eukprot:scaffold1381_cov386-Prasinococcus_capsulatus_cf.AAC.4
MMPGQTSDGTAEGPTKVAAHDIVDGGNAPALAYGHSCNEAFAAEELLQGGQALVDMYAGVYPQKLYLLIVPVALSGGRAKLLLQVVEHSSAIRICGTIAVVPYVGRVSAEDERTHPLLAQHTPW